MSWFNSAGRDVPEKLKGKSEADILAAMEKAEKADQLATEKAAADTAKAKADADLATLQTEHSSVKSRLSQLESNATRQQQPPPERKGPTSVLLDEETAFQERLTPLYLQQAQQGALMAMQLAANDISQDPRKAALLKKHKAEVDARFATVPIQFKADPMSYKNCFNVVMGEHMEELLTAASKKEGEFFVEDSSHAARPAESKQSDKLDEAEVKIAARMGVTPEQYLARRKSMQFVGA